MNYSRPLGSGSFATVYVATSRATAHEYAVKEVDKTRKKIIGDPSAGAAETPQMRAERIRDRERQQREVEILLSVSHPHVASCAAVYETDERLWFVMPFARGGDVFSFMNRRKTVTEDEVRSVVHQVAAALSYLHATGIVHRDIKLENLLLLHPDPNPAAGENQWTAEERRQRLRSLHVLVSDFGLSRIVRNDGSVILTMCGTPVYVAPEVVCTSLREGEGYTPAVDMFSLGVVAYALLTRRPPFPFAMDPRTGQRTKNKIQYNAPLVWPEAAGVSAAARQCVESMLSLDPSRRPSATEVLAMPWVADAPSKQQPTAFGVGAVVGAGAARKRDRDE
jgi:serine/threonine protein kinase